MQIIEQPGNILGQAGKAFLQGVGEQLPQEVERSRLAKGLEEITKKAKQGGSALDLLKGLWTTPGVTPEMATQALPYLQSAGLASQKQTEKNQPTTTTSPEGHQPFRRIGTEEALQNRAIELHKSNPLLYPTQAAGLAGAKREYDTQTDLTNSIDSQFDKVLSTKIQKNGDATYASVLGDLQRKFRDKALDDALEGKLTKDEAVNKYTKEALDFAKTKTNLDALGFGSFFRPGKTLNSLDSIKNKYKKLGLLQEFNNEIISKFDLTDQNASSLTFPVEENKSLSKYLSDIPYKAFPKSTNSILSSEGNIKRGKAIPVDEVVTNIAKHIGEDDSLFSILNELEKKNYDPGEVMKAVKNAWLDGKIRLNNRQSDELGKNPSPRPSLGDLFLFTLTGKKALGEEQ